MRQFDPYPVWALEHGDRFRGEKEKTKEKCKQ
jgi:hypothetical protein